MYRSKTGAASGPEAYGLDLYKVAISNTLGQPIHIEEIEFEVNNVDSPVSTQNVGLTVAAAGSGEITGPFTEFISATIGLKAFAATTTKPVVGTYDVVFTISGHTESGDSFSTSVSSAVTFGNIDRCG